MRHVTLSRTKLFMESSKCVLVRLKRKIVNAIQILLKFLSNWRILNRKYRNLKKLRAHQNIEKQRLLSAWARPKAVGHSRSTNASSKVSKNHHSLLSGTRVVGIRFRITSYPQINKIVSLNYPLAIDLYDKDWKKVTEYVGTRISAQVRSHA